MSFSNIRGQDTAVRSLKNAINNNRLAHAYIFSGPEGCGRSLLARNFAKALNCEKKKDDACDFCTSCKKIDKYIHPDVKWLNKDGKGSQIKIEQIRELENQIVLKPYEAKYKVFIIKDAQLMTAEAANSFLKTLEEPPPNSVLILITERPKDLFRTIVSRCQLIRIKPFSTEELSFILVTEYNMQKKKAELLSRISEGRLGRAIDYSSDVLTLRDKILEEFSSDDSVEDYSARDRDDLARRLNVLLSWYRDLLVFKVTHEEDLIINFDKVNDIKVNEKSYKTTDLLDIFENVLDAKERIGSNVNPKLALSVMFKEIEKCTK
jgi:DNA polymerase III subunit delta'